MPKWVIATILAGLLTFPALPQTSAPALGRKIFEAQCALCHGQTGGGGRGPGLNRPTLSHAPDADALKQVIENGIPPEMPGAWQLHPSEVEAVAAYVRSLGAVPSETLPGDPSRGEKIYLAKGCPGCHVLAGKGEGFGPELTEIGARRNGAHLRQAILQPGTLLPEGFLFLQVTLSDGKTLRGIRVNEDTFNLQLKDAQGQFHSLSKASLKSLQRLKGETPMPSYQNSLTASELDDLVAWLSSRKGRS